MTRMVSTAAIVYETTAGDILYSNGALLVEQGDGSSMFGQPRFTLQDDGLIVPLEVMNHDSE